MSYPTVLTEDQTLDAVLDGRSLARIGDGELKLARGLGLKAQSWSPKIAAAMREVCAGKGSPCLAAIPNLFAHQIPGERAGYVSFCSSARNVSLYGRGPYGSSFISRPDVAPHIDRPDYWAKFRGLWAGKDVVLVWGSGKGLTPGDLTAARSYMEVKAPAVEAWDCFDDIFDRLRFERRTVLLSLGATATALAWRLAIEGVHAVDVGNAGRFMRAHARTQRN